MRIFALKSPAIALALLSATPTFALVHAVSLKPVSPTSFRGGFHRSNCIPVSQDPKQGYSRLDLEIDRKVGGVYRSEETLFSDPACQISVLRTNTLGRWKIARGAVLTLEPASIRLMPLDPRVADAMDANRACGKRWRNAEANEVARTACGREKIAQYFMNRRTPRTFELYDCEGKTRPDDSCSRYRMASTVARASQR